MIHTPHGVIETPAFVPVGTQATVKSLTPEELDALGVQLFFVNTYHAYLRPGAQVIQKAGGLHTFMNWQKSLITDSGGFQVFSLGAKRYVNIAISESAVLDKKKYFLKLSRQDATKFGVYPDDYRPVGELVRIDESGVTFTSHWDGSKHRFTPKQSMHIQFELGADIHIAFDECPPYPTTKVYARSALMRTHRWAEESLVAHQLLNAKSGALFQSLYGVIQGSVFEDLRQESALYITGLDFDGFAIGGVAVGESKEEMKHVLEWVVPFLPEGKPRHLLGVGEIDDIFTSVEHGMDTFDCVQPTRLARMGKLFSTTGRTVERTFEIDITKQRFSTDLTPIDPGCACYTCRSFSKAYLHHLFRVRELLAYRLATIHNLHFVLNLTSRIREAILRGEYNDFRREYFQNKL